MQILDETIENHPLALVATNLALAMLRLEDAIEAQARNRWFDDEVYNPALSKEVDDARLGLIDVMGDYVRSAASYAASKLDT
jgi:hypothetical protein